MTSLRPSFFSKWAAQRRIARLPEIQLARQANYYMTNTSPNPDWTATIATSAGIRVGTATYAVTPLDDQLWLYGLEIAPAHRRHGYALALLWQLHQAHRLPIHPVHELGTAGGALSYAGGTCLLFGPGEAAVLSAGPDGASFVFAHAQPLRESIAWGGPIVMNTREELEAAFRELDEGTFIRKRKKAK